MFSLIQKTACAEVLLAGEEGGSNAKTVFAGMGLAAVFKMLVDGIILAILAVAGVDKAIDLSGSLDTGTIGGVVLFIIMMLCIAKSALPKKKKEKAE